MLGHASDFIGRADRPLSVREEIELLRVQDAGVRDVVRVPGRDPGTISRELRRNAATRSGKREYRATVAQWKAQQAAAHPKTAKLVDNPRLREYVGCSSNCSWESGRSEATGDAMTLARLSGSVPLCP